MFFFYTVINKTLHIQAKYFNFFSFEFINCENYSLIVYKKLYNKYTQHKRKLRHKIKILDLCNFYFLHLWIFYYFCIWTKFFNGSHGYVKVISFIIYMSIQNWKFITQNSTGFLLYLLDNKRFNTISSYAFIPYISEDINGILCACKFIKRIFNVAF